MAIFPVLDLENKVQVNDKTRLDATESFVSKDEAGITLVEIEPEAGSGFVDVTGSSSSDWFLDWQYSGSSRTVTVTVRVTTDGSPVSHSETIEVLTVSDDNLYSDDRDLIASEPDILKWVPRGRSSFLNVHREAQKRIIEHFNNVGIWDNDNDRLTKDAIIDEKEVNDWSRFLTLSIIFQGISNDVEDVFSEKSIVYSRKAVQARDRSIIRIDQDGDGSVDEGERQNLTSLRLTRK